MPLAHVANLQQLTSLKLYKCDWVTDTDLSHIANLQLTSLNLKQCVRITDVGLFHVGNLQQLTSLNLSGCDKNHGQGAGTCALSAGEVNRLTSGVFARAHCER